MSTFLRLVDPQCPVESFLRVDLVLRLVVAVDDVAGDWLVLDVEAVSTRPTLLPLIKQDAVVEGFLIQSLEPSAALTLTCLRQRVMMLCRGIETLLTQPLFFVIADRSSVLFVSL